MARRVQYVSDVSKSKQMKYLVLLGLTIISSNLLGYGIGDWSHITPNGNVMGDPGSGTSLYINKTRQEILGINKWYFYKDKIVGKAGKEHFVVDEKEGEVIFFRNRNEWLNFIQVNNLEPSIFTRWYTDNWVDGDHLLVWLIFLPFISVPFILLFLFALYKAITKERFGITRPYTAFVLATTILISSVLILDCYPQSF
jgi:hypothetical protein